MGRLDGKVVIITGGARGQGEQHVRLFAAEGAKVVFGDVLDNLGEKVAADLGDNAIYLHHDVRSEDEWQRTGTHEEMGPYSVERWLEVYAAHAHDHAAQIRRARGQA